MLMSMSMPILMSPLSIPLLQTLSTLTLTTNMESTQLDQPLHLSQQSNILLEIIRLAKLLMRFQTRPSDKSNKHTTGLALVSTDWYVILYTPAVADAAPVGRCLQGLGGELFETTGGGCAGCHGVVAGEEGDEDFCYWGAGAVEDVLWWERIESYVFVDSFFETDKRLERFDNRAMITEISSALSTVHKSFNLRALWIIQMIIQRIPIQKQPQPRRILHLKTMIHPSRTRLLQRCLNDILISLPRGGFVKDVDALVEGDV